MRMSKPDHSDIGETSATGAQPLVDVRDVKMHFPITSGLFNRQVGSVKAVDGVSFSLQEGETFGLVGESGSGKTTVGRLIMGLHTPTDGEIMFDGEDITSYSKSELKQYRKRVQIVYQDASSSLNPRKTIHNLISAPLKIHDIGDKSQRNERVEELMDLVKIPQRYQYRYPNALSGGQKQRVAIARALAVEPEILILDEPTSALDVSVQANVIDLLEELQDDLGLSMLFISHDISLVKSIADRIGVMYLGKFMEVAPIDRLFEEPLNPYTKSLLSSIPTLKERENRYKPDADPPSGEIPDPSNPPSGCVFHTRCPKKEERCEVDVPTEFEAEPGHSTWCHVVKSKWEDSSHDGY